MSSSQKKIETVRLRSDDDKRRIDILDLDPDLDELQWENRIVTDIFM